MAEDLLAVGVKSHIPQSNTVHQFLGVFEFAIAAEDRFDELATGVTTHRDRPLAAFPLGGLPHELLARLEQLLEAPPQPFAALEETLDGLLRVGALDAAYALVRPLHLARQLDQQQPQLARHIRHGRRRPVVEHRPVVDPLAQRVGVEHAAQQDDRHLRRVPVLDRVPRRDPRAGRVLLGGVGGRFGCRGGLGLLGRARRRRLPAGARPFRGVGIFVHGDLVIKKVLISGGLGLAGRRSSMRRVGARGGGGSGSGGSSSSGGGGGGSRGKVVLVVVGFTVGTIIDHIHKSFPRGLMRRVRTGGIDGNARHGSATTRPTRRIAAVTTASKESTYIVVLARGGAILGHGLGVVRGRPIGAMPPVFGGSRIAGFAAVTLGATPRGGIRSGEGRGVVGVVRRGRRGGHVVVGPPRMGLRIVIHYRRMSMRININTNQTKTGCGRP